MATKLKKKKTGLLTFFGIAPQSFESVGGMIRLFQASRRSLKVVEKNKAIFDEIARLREESKGGDPEQKAEVSKKINALLERQSRLRF